MKKRRDHFFDGYEEKGDGTYNWFCSCGKKGNCRENTKYSIGDWTFKMFERHEKKHFEMGD